MSNIKGYRGLNSARAREVRQKGHDDARAFSDLLGLSSDYRNNATGKKDVIDQNGDTHSLKSGSKKWQIFLYARSRFATDDDWQAMPNDVANILIDCIDCFPEDFNEYLQNKEICKLKLENPMAYLKVALEDKLTLKLFLKKSFFNSNEVEYLTIYHDDYYHVFHVDDVLDTFLENFIIENSSKKATNQFNCQKVLFKFNGKNVGELEMRNDSLVHYRQIRFNMLKVRATELLITQIKDFKIHPSGSIYVYGRAIKKFLSGRTIL